MAQLSRPVIERLLQGQRRIICKAMCRAPRIAREGNPKSYN